MTSIMVVMAAWEGVRVTEAATILRRPPARPWAGSSAVALLRWRREAMSDSLIPREMILYGAPASQALRQMAHMGLITGISMAMLV
jgi:hypothetical protein